MAYLDKNGLAHLWDKIKGLIPTKTSDLTNDSGYITDYTETDPTVPSHVKNITQANITNWNNKADTNDIPTKTSDLTNDSGFVDSSYHDSTKQNSLVSGTNIKTINNQSLLGSGNIDIQGGSGGDTLPIGTIVDYDGDTVPEGYEEYQPKIKLKLYQGSITVGGNSFGTTNLGSLNTPSGYTFVGLIPNSSGYGDQWVVSFSLYSGNVQAMVHSRYSSSLTNTLKAYALFIKTDELSNMIFS